MSEKFVPVAGIDESGQRFPVSQVDLTRTSLFEHLYLDRVINADTSLAKQEYATGPLAEVGSLDSTVYAEILRLLQEGDDYGAEFTLKHHGMQLVHDFIAQEFPPNTVLRRNMLNMNPLVRIAMIDQWDPSANVGGHRDGYGLETAQEQASMLRFTLNVGDGNTMFGSGLDVASISDQHNIGRPFAHLSSEEKLAYLLEGRVGTMYVHDWSTIHSPPYFRGDDGAWAVASPERIFFSYDAVMNFGAISEAEAERFFNDYYAVEAA